ncbi:conserved hypothetical protein [Bradyrhizobium sp. ORS 285]|nr:conserved hypothetical protein [Bradyrhizobium sp. ORS 285]
MVVLRRERKARGGTLGVSGGLMGLERAKGIEPSYAAWEAAVLPLNYARKRLFLALRHRLGTGLMPG